MARKDSDDDKANDQPDGSEENFGLPDIEFKPLSEPAETKPSEEAKEQSVAPSSADSDSGGGASSDSYEAYSPEGTKSNAPIILGVVIVLVLAVAGYLIYNFVYKPRAEESARKEQLAKEEVQRRNVEAARLAKEKAAEEQRLKDEALAAAIPVVGTIEVLGDRTRRYYVVVSSDIDDDLLMDYAKKLSATGVSMKIIPPFGGKKFHRLAIDDDETFALAQVKADAAKTTYGAGVWVLRY